MREKIGLGYKTGEYVKTTAEAGCYIFYNNTYSYEKDCI